MRLSLPVCLLLALLGGCGGGGGDSSQAGAPEPPSTPMEPPTEPADPPVLPAAAVDWDRNLLAVDLELDLERLQGTAIISVEAAASEALSLEVGDLEVHEVRAEINGEQVSLNHAREAAALHIGFPRDAQGGAVEIRYAFSVKEDFSGYSPDGYTFLWPYFCGNLFPCKSQPGDGVVFDLRLVGIDPSNTAVFPPSIPNDSPSYAIAFALGEYDYIDLGATSLGTQVGVWHLPGQRDIARRGAANLREVFDWYESTYGPYTLGGEVASVAAPWRDDVYGGIEHHPFWHIATDALDDAEVHAHEAAHGWFGNGVRMACWEDFVLSEGLATYMAARAVEAVSGQLAGAEIWQRYESRLDRLVVNVPNYIAWPEGCGDIDVLTGGLYTDAPYVLGAFFLRALEVRVGRAALDAALASFYREHVGSAASFSDLLEWIAMLTGYDPTTCAHSWLRGDTVPIADTCE